MFEITGHHSGDVLYGFNGEEISCAAINFHDQTFDKVTSYQFYQESVGYCTLYVVPKEPLGEIDIKNIIIALTNKFAGALVCKVSVVDKVRLTDRGKYKMIIQSPELIDRMH